MSSRYPLCTSSILDLPEIWPIPNRPRIEEHEIIAEESEESEESEDLEESKTIPAIMAAIEWKTYPYHGNFNPGTPLGHKIFLEKSKGLELEKRFDLTKTNALDIRKYLLARESNMGDEMRKIPIAWDGAGTVVQTANLLTQYHLFLLEHLQRAAHVRLNLAIAQGDPIPPHLSQQESLAQQQLMTRRKVFTRRLIAA